jgi:hypothetical protein
MKKFFAKDFIFNNGIVNFASFLDNIGKEYKLTNSYLEIYDDSDEFFYEYLSLFLKENKIVYQTNNDRWYFDEEKKDFVKDKKFDTLGGGKNDLRNGIYLYKKIDEFGLTKEEVENSYLAFCKREGLKPEIEKNGKLKVPNKKNEIIVHISLDEATKRFASYLVKSDKLKLDSKIHIFEDGQNSFHDMLKIPKDYKIDKWDALVYWFGGKIERWYNREFFIYPNSSNLLYLRKLKEHLNISNEAVTLRDEKEKVITLPINIDFYNQLLKDEITNRYFYISKSEEEFLVKLLIYLFSYFYHIEDNYQNASKKRKKRYEELVQILPYITFIVYKDDGTFKTAFMEFSKAYRVFEFLYKLKEKEAFVNFIQILTLFSIISDGMLAKEFVSKFLNFLELRGVYFKVAFEILKDDRSSGFRGLEVFENLYLEELKKGAIMSLHSDSKIIGEGIGYICGALDDKDLLFKLRNVKNYKQLISFFKDVKFELLKEENIGVSKEFNEALTRVLENIEKNWEIVRDYIAIYAIDKYKAVKFAKKGE